MGAGASTIADYKEGCKNADEASFPEAFAKLKTDVETKVDAGDDAAAVLAYATEQCKELKLAVRLDTEYQSETGRGKLFVSAAGGEEMAPAEVEVLEKLANTVALELLEAKTQSIVCLTDGSKNAHKAFEVAKSLRKDDDVLSVVHVKSDKDYHGENEYKSDQIKLRYETELAPLLPKEKWRYEMVLKEDSVSTKRSVGLWVSGLRDVLVDDSRKHPMPNFLCIGFSGRKSIADEAPSVLGQVADLSLRTVPCPCVVVKYPPSDGPKAFCLLVADLPRCWIAFELLLHLPGEGDSLKLIHVYEDVAESITKAKELKEKYEAFLAGKETKFTVDFELKAKERGSATSGVIHELLDEATYEYIGIATHPKDHIGSIADYLIKHYKGNVICFKGEHGGPQYA